MTKSSGKKGFEMEEHLRHYFNKLGYYVSRGVKFNYGESDASDIDLWLYGRSSAFSRNITVVDIKNKRQPKAIERMLWVYGLKEAVNADHAILATTDKRKLVKEFGEKLDILVLDGNFLNKLKNTQGDSKGRLTEEEFFDLFASEELTKLDGDWKSRINFSKSLLCGTINYDSFNALLDEACFFAKRILETTTRAKLAYRCFALVCSLLCICVDYLMKNVGFLDHSDRLEELNDGFAFGSNGKEGTGKVIENAIQLIEQYSDANQISTSKIRNRVDDEISSLRTNILSEYFAKPDVAKSLFSIAKELELATYREPLNNFNNLSVELRGFVLMLLDFWEIDRTRFSSQLSSI